MEWPSLLNFDAKIRRQSIDPEDLFYAHIGGMDTCAKTLLATEKLINDKIFSWCHFISHKNLY